MALSSEIIPYFSHLTSRQMSQYSQLLYYIPCNSKTEFRKNRTKNHSRFDFLFFFFFFSFWNFPLLMTPSKLKIERSVFSRTTQTSITSAIQVRVETYKRIIEFDDEDLLGIANNCYSDCRLKMFITNELFDRLTGQETSVTHQEERRGAQYTTAGDDSAKAAPPSQKQREGDGGESHQPVNHALSCVLNVPSMKERAGE